MRLRLSLAALLVVAVATLAAAGGAAAATTPSTSINATPQQVAQYLFAAGDAGRLAEIPSGTESTILEKVLQQLYIENPSLDAGSAVSDIQGLQNALTTGSTAVSTGTLSVQPGNERILTIIEALQGSSPPADVAHALDQVDDQALTGAAQSAAIYGQAFSASADSLDTLDYAGFDPGRVLTATAALAASDHAFGQARDMLWKSASHESVFDDTQTLLGANPALQTDAIKQFTAMLGADGSLQTTVGALENAIKGDQVTVGNQNCTLAGGTTGASPSDCAHGALADAQLVAKQCPSANPSAAACLAAKGQAQSDAADELNTIRAEEAPMTAAAAALGAADQNLQQAEYAASQASVQIAEEENEYLNYQSTQSIVKGAFDVAGIAVALSVSEIDPVAVFSAVTAVAGDALGLTYSGPDPSQIVLAGIQEISQQISDFENYTQAAFSALDSQLSTLSGQIATAAYQLSAQLTQVQLQVTQLATKLTNLQSSVDHLQSEVQTLFAQGARNDLSTLINQDLGYQQANGTALPQAQFAQAAGALYQDATGTALTQTVLNVPSGFDALGANSLVTSTDPLSLDSNINYFNLFGSQVTDSPVNWPGALTTTCAPGANTAQGLCLPDPDFWATSARAFAQLLDENPQYVTATRLTQLQTINNEGQLIENALHQLSVNDAGADPQGTGNKTLDDAAAYYQTWGDGTHASSAAPSLAQALHNVEAQYLSNQQSGSTGLTDVGVDPWGGNTQQPDYQNIAQLPGFTTMPLCASEITALGAPPYTQKVLPSVPQALYSFLPRQVLNAARLGIGTLSPCWTGNFYSSSNTGGEFKLEVHFTYTLGSVSDEVGKIVFDEQTPFCGITNEATGSNQRSGVDETLANWGGTSTTNSQCVDWSTVLSDPDLQTAEYPSDVSSVVEPALTTALGHLQNGIYSDILSNGSTLTSGTGQSTDVQSAAQRLNGASALLDGYVSLGLPEAIASDDTLHSLVAGADADAFAPTDPNLNLFGATPAATVPEQIVEFYKAAQAYQPSFDPAFLVRDLVDLHVFDLQRAVRGHIVPAVPSGNVARLATKIRANAHGTPARVTAKVLAAAARASRATAPSSGVLDESDQLIGPTVDTLAETSAVLQDTMTHGASLFVMHGGTGTGTVSDGGPLSCSGACSHTYSPGTAVTLTATPATGSTFTGWSGACSGTGSCTLLLNSDQAVTATFAGSSASTSGGATTVTTPTTTGTTATPPPPAHTAARCSVALVSATVLLGTRKRAGMTPRTVRLAITCSQAAKARVTARLTWTAAKRKHAAQLPAMTVRLAAGRTARVSERLPAAVIRALRQRASVRAAVTVRATNANGAGTASAQRTLVGVS